MKSLLATVSLLIAFSATSVFGQLPLPGACPAIKPVANFNSSLYQGIWHEAAKYKFIPELTCACVSCNYTLQTDGTFNTQIRCTDTITGKKMVFLGQTILRDPDTPVNAIGDMQLNLQLYNPYFPQTAIQQTYMYNVISTDYTTYTIKYACSQFPSPLNLIHFTSLWVLTRDPAFPPAVQQTVSNEMKKLGLDNSLAQTSDRNCPVSSSIGTIG